MFKFVSAAALALACSPAVNAQVIFSDDFSTVPDGAFDGVALANGTGTFDTVGTVAASGGAVVLTADGGRDQFGVIGTGAVLAGQLSFDVAFTAPVATPAAPDVFFLQLVDGPTRSTGGSPVPNFAFNLDASGLGISTDATALSSFDIVFNVTDDVLSYTDPGGAAATLGAGLYQVFVNGVAVGDPSANNNNTGGIPTGGVDSFIVQTFGGQSGAVFVFDNVALTAIPEPASAALMAAGGLLLMRRKKTA